VEGKRTQIHESRIEWSEKSPFEQRFAYIYICVCVCVCVCVFSSIGERCTD
jgi:hypothetical protein